MSTAKKLSLCTLFLLLCPALSWAEDGKLTGLWSGKFNYGDGGGPRPVKFKMIMVQEGGTIGGFVREPNSFGERREQPALHASFKGSFDEKTGKVTFTKTYDGTAGVSHDVEYTGDLSQDGGKIEGTWSIGGANGGFVLEKVAKTNAGRFAGVWSGEYQYAKESGQEPVKFAMVMVHDRQNFVGFIKEPNTFGEDKEEPALHALVRGRFDEKTGKLTITKIYDGTAGVDHDVDYSGQLAKDGEKFEGTWTLRDGSTGRFTIEKLRLDEQSLGSLK